jgi:hypothetical protein
MHLQEIGWESMDWMDLTQDRDKWWAVANVAMNHQVSQNARNFLTSCKMTSSSWWTVLLYRMCLIGNQCRQWCSNNFLCISYVLHASTCLLLFIPLSMIL